MWYNNYTLLSFDRLDQDEINIFEATEAGYNAARINAEAQVAATIAELLLANPATAIMHVPKPDKDETSLPVLLAANYHGSSEGWHRIIVQDPENTEAGQWELWTPPDARNETFYRRSLWSGEPYPFDDQPPNPDKIHQFFAHVGPTDDAIRSFEEQGYVFTSDLLDPDSKEHARLQALADAAPFEWAVS